jgi:uncharacterized protein (DUF2062 family)
MSFYFAFLVCAASGALVITVAGFAVFVWLQVFDHLEERRTRKRQKRKDSF